MDNITHASLGILAAILTAPAELRKKAALAGLIAAELPDLDSFIFSPGDPLFGLQMHRHFSHALIMIPVLGLLGVLLANGLRKLFRRPAQWRGMWLPAMVAAATHGFCDVWTSYGTHLLWPFTDRRDSWDLISVVDPLMTLPLLVCAILAWKRGRRRPAWAGCAWMVFYLLLCAGQHHRAEMAVREWAAEHHHSPERLTVKPSLANILVWRGLYVHDGICQVVCVRPGLTGGTRVLGTSSAPLLDPDHPAPPLDALPADSVAMSDVRRFRHFSDDWMGRHPDQPNVIGDLRYAMRPDLVSPLWGIEVDPAEPGHHVKLAYFRRADEASWGALWRMITGQQ
jgi:inner membrane protein